jgi:uncharacterized repeat protein (TIGR03803 family)
MARKKPMYGLPRIPMILAIILAVVANLWAAPKYKVLHAFSGGNDGMLPFAGVTLGPAGNLYGTTEWGGDNGSGMGTVFKLTNGASGIWKEAVLYSFTGGSDGDSLYSGLILGPAGSLYGTTSGGALGGTAFELAPSSDGWTVSYLYKFGNGQDGASPFAGLVLDGAGNLYGTTQNGGPPGGGGTVFKLAPSSGGVWTETIIDGFTAKDDGLNPEAGLTWDAAGNLYGTTRFGGGYYQHCSAGCGTVFKLSPNSDGKWKEHMLHRFNWIPGGNNDGLAPYAGVIFDSAGNLYGTTAGGGDNKCEAGCGTVFKLTPLANGRWKETILHTFHFDQDGHAPFGGLVMDKAGNLYGTTTWGGVNGAGTVFKLAPGSNGKWNYSVLHRFTGPDGAQSYASLIFDKSGKHLYGTTAYGGTYGYGVVFEITP